jgi:hypothetical protein
MKLAPIGPVRVAAVRPALPGPTDDPSRAEPGVELVTDMSMVPVFDQVDASAASGDAQLDLSQRAFAANATSTSHAIGSLAMAEPFRVPNLDASGNISISTGFDPRPASNLGGAPRGDFATPFARALSASAAR